MTPIPFQIDRASVDALGWTLLHFLWQGAAVAALLAAAQLVLARASAEARYLAGCAALALMLALPVVTFVSIHAQVPAPAMDSDLVVTRGTSPVSMPHLGGAAPRPAAPARALVVPGAAAPIARLSNLIRATRLPGLPRALPHPLPWVVGAWVLGVALLTLRLIGGWWLVRRLARSPLNAPLPDWQERFSELTRAIGVSKPVRLCRSALVQVPTAIGVLKPMILLPASTLTGLSPRQIEAILAHELAHLRRHDYLVNLMQSVIETLLFYHPAVWWVSRRVREERELCCDDLAVRVCGDPVMYAAALCELESLRGSEARFALAASGGSLLTRIARLLRAPRPGRREPRSIGGLAITGVLALLTLVSLDVTAGSGPAPPLLETLRVQSVTRIQQTTATVTRTATRFATVTIAPMMRALAVESVPMTASSALPTSAVAPAVASDFGPGTPAPASECGNACPEKAANASEQCSEKSEAEADRAADAADAQDAADDEDSGDTGTPVALANLSDADRKKFERLGIDTKYVAALAAAGYKSLSTNQVKVLSDHGVSCEYIRALRTLGLDDLRVDQLVALSDQGVSSKYIAGLKHMNPNSIKVENLIRLSNSGVTPEWYSAMAWLGYSDLSIERAIQLANNGVTPEYVSQLRVMTHERPSPEELIRLVQQGVTPLFVAELRGFVRHDFTTEELVKLSQQGVTAEYVEKMKAVGYGDLVVEDLIRLRQQGVEPEYVAEMTASIGHPLPVTDLIRLFQSGANAEVVNRLREVGNADPGVEDVIRTAQTGVPKVSKKH